MFRGCGSHGNHIRNGSFCSIWSFAHSFFINLFTKTQYKQESKIKVCLIYKNLYQSITTIGKYSKNKLCWSNKNYIRVFQHLSILAILLACHLAITNFKHYRVFSELWFCLYILTIGIALRWCWNLKCKAKLCQTNRFFESYVMANFHRNGVYSFRTTVQKPQKGAVWRGLRHGVYLIKRFWVRSN